MKYLREFKCCFINIFFFAPNVRSRTNPPVDLINIHSSLIFIDSTLIPMPR